MDYLDFDEDTEDEPKMKEIEEEEEKEDKENQVQVQKLKKGSILNFDKSINDEYKTLLEEKGYLLPSKIFNKQQNVENIIKQLKKK